MIGLDIGSFYTKIGHYDKRSGKLKNKVIEKTPANCVNNGLITDINKITSFINDIIKKNNIKEKNICFCIASTGIIIREITMPTMKDDELKNALQYEVDQYIPNINDYVVDYKPLGASSDNDKNMRVMIVAAPKNIIIGYVKLADMLKLHIEAIDVYSNCIYKSIKKLCKLTGNVSIINIGAVFTDITLINEGNYAFSRTIQFGGNDLTEIIANTYNIDISNAEEYKRTKPFFSDENPDYFDLRENIEGHLENKLNEIIRVFDFFESTYHKNIKEIYLVGGTSKLKGLSKYIENYFKVPVITYDSDDYVYFLPVLGSLMRGE